MIKEIAAFTENNIRPLVDEANKLLDRVEKAGFKLSKESLTKLIDRAGLFVIINSIINGIVKVIAVVFICETILRTLV